MPSYRFNQKTKVAGSTPNRIKYLCPHPDCKQMAPLACASTYARHYRSAHLKERPWACDHPYCTFETTRKTLLQQHKLHVHSEEVVLPKRQRGTLTPVAPPQEVEVNEHDEIVCYRPTRPNRTWTEHSVREVSPAGELFLMSGPSRMPMTRAPVGHRRPSLTVRTSSSPSSYSMTPMAIPTLPNFSTPPPQVSSVDSQMSYDSPMPPFSDFSTPMGMPEYPAPAGYSFWMSPESALHPSAYGSATAVDSAVPWNVWSGPITPPPKPVFPQTHTPNWDNALSSSSSASPSNSPTPFPDMSLEEQPMFDPELQNILNGIGELKEYTAAF